LGTAVLYTQLAYIHVSYVSVRSSTMTVSAGFESINVDEFVDDEIVFLEMEFKRSNPAPKNFRFALNLIM